jgi:hypothetical protein
MPYRNHYDPNQPRVPAGQHDGGQWTDGGHPDYPSARPIQYAPIGPAVRQAVAALFAYFAWRSQRNTPNEKSIIVFKARDYYRDGPRDFDVEGVGTLTKDEVDSVCKRLQRVQALTDYAATRAKPFRGLMRPADYGTLVHKYIKEQIDKLGDQNFRAEISHIKGREDAQPYAAKDTVRVDVFERRDQATVCVYDIKTGRSGLSPARFGEIASSVFSAYGPVQRIIITEVRPTP